MPVPIVDDVDAAAERYIQNFLKTFKGSRLEYRGVYDAEDDDTRKGYVAVRELLDEGRRVVDRSEIENKIAALYGEDERPTNLDQVVLPNLFDYGLLLPVDRFSNAGYNWYFADKQFLDDIEAIDRDHTDTVQLNDRSKTMAAYLEKAELGDDNDHLIAWLAGYCATYADFVGHDARFETLKSSATAADTTEEPDGYLLSDYRRTGNRADRFDEYLVHAELHGDFDFESKPLVDRTLRQQFEILQAAASHGDLTSNESGTTKPNFEEIRWELINQEAGPSAEEWQTKLGSGAVCFSVETEVTDTKCIVSCYRGKWN